MKKIGETVTVLEERDAVIVIVGDSPSFIITWDDLVEAVEEALKAQPAVAAFGENNLHQISSSILDSVIARGAL
jgi:adenosine/AMP kinase